MFHKEFEARKKMQVLALEGPVGSKVLNLKEESFPIPKRGEVVIKVNASGVNELDILRTRGEYELPPDWSHVPGLECVGEIIEVGEDVHEWKVGDEVCALLNGGGYAQAVAVRATQVLPLPSKLKFVVGSLPEAACTTWEAISRLSKLSADMTLLVYERCGLICNLAVQLAEIVQAKVIVARDDEGETFLRSFYPHLVVDVNSLYFTPKILEATGRKGVDVILDCNASTVNYLKTLRYGGTVVLVGLDPKEKAIVNLGSICEYDAVLHVVNRMWWTPEYIAEVVLDMKKNMWPSFSSGRLVVPLVKKLRPVSEAAKAQSGDIIGPM